jgi:hypothetical protein
MGEAGLPLWPCAAFHLARNAHPPRQAAPRGEKEPGLEGAGGGVGGGPGNREKGKDDRPLYVHVACVHLPAGRPPSPALHISATFHRDLFTGKPEARRLFLMEIRPSSRKKARAHPRQRLRALARASPPTPVNIYLSHSPSLRFQRQASNGSSRSRSRWMAEEWTMAR